MQEAAEALVQEPQAGDDPPNDRRDLTSARGFRNGLVSLREPGVLPSQVAAPACGCPASSPDRHRDPSSQEGTPGPIEAFRRGGDGGTPFPAWARRYERDAW